MQQNEQVVGAVNSQVVLFANGVGVSFKDGDKIASNAALIDFLETSDDVVKEGDFTNFSINHAQLGHFLHMAFCHASEGYKVQADFDGIYPFQAQDEQGELRWYNAQLITISEVAAQ